MSGGLWLVACMPWVVFGWTETLAPCALSTGEVRELNAASAWAALSNSTPCILYDTGGGAAADVVEATVVQAGRSDCTEHLAGAKVMVDTLNALNGGDGFAVGSGGGVFVRLRLVTVLTGPNAPGSVE